MPGKFKVFRAHLGFFDTIVAAPSRKAALAAWGANAREFSQGFAVATDDPKLTAVALAQPGIVLKRQFGSKGGFAAEPARLAAPKASKRRQAVTSKRQKNREKAEAKKAAARQRAEIDRDEARALEDIADRQAALREIKTVRAGFAERRRQVRP